MSLFFTFFFAFVQPKIAFADTYTLSGNVSDSTGVEIDGATVDVINLSNNTTVASVNTTSEGNYTVLVNGGTYNVKVTPPAGSNYTPATALNQNISSNEVVNFILVPAGTVKLDGYLYNSEGDAASNQRVVLVGSAGEIATVTNESGYYTLTVASGTYTLRFQNFGYNAPSKNLPRAYEFERRNFIFEESTTLNITLPTSKVDIHVQNNVGESVDQTQVYAHGAGFHTFNIDGATYYGTSYYPNDGSGGVTTDTTGDVDLWLFPGIYTLQATPPSPFVPFFVNNKSITGEQTEIISLQYNHATPTTTAVLETEHLDGTYSDPTTVTLSAVADDGYTIANTYYKVDGGSVQTYTGPFTVSGISEHVLEYWSVDNSGVQEQHKTKAFNIYINQAPYVDPLPDVTIDEGETYVATGSFTDSDSSSWTATVDYDDGAGEVPLTLNPDKTFSLSHQYTTAGEYDVTVIVRDNQQSTGMTSPNVTVLSTSVPIGYPTPGDTEDSSNRNVMNATKITVGPVGGTVDSMSVYVGDIDVSPNNVYQMAIYTSKVKNNNDVIPETLVAQTTTGTLTANSWNTLPISATLSANTSYWLAYNTKSSSDSLNNMYFSTANQGIGVYANQTFGTWPAGYPNNPTITNQKFSLYASFTSSGPAPTVLAGNTVVEEHLDENNAGRAEAFKFTALTSGTASNIVLYLNNNNAASQVRVGIYADSNGNPGTRLSQTVITSPIKDQWNTVTLPATTITAGTNYWIAILSPQGSGKVRFRDKASGGTSVGSQQTNLTTLPATWTTNQTWTTTDLSAYVY